MLPEISASAQVGFPILSLIILLPAIAAVVVRSISDLAPVSSDT